MKNIKVKGAREHNLKNINVELPRDKFIVITGLSGSGKSTTLAAMIHEINVNDRKHIITIEDPIEFVHKDKSLRVSCSRDAGKKGWLNLNR